MPHFTVTEVSTEVRKYDTDYGPKKAYRVHLRNGDGTDHLNIELRRNADSQAPTVGQQFEGDLVDQGQYGQRLQLANRGGAGGTWSGTKDSKEYKADPVKQAAIAMESAQKSAVEIMRLAMECKAWTPSQDDRPISEMTGVVKTIAQSLYAQITEASGAAS